MFSSLSANTHRQLDKTYGYKKDTYGQLGVEPRNLKMIARSADACQNVKSVPVMYDRQKYSIVRAAICRPGGGQKKFIGKQVRSHSYLDGFNRDAFLVQLHT
jgi:hypothetical protein